MTKDATENSLITIPTESVFDVFTTEGAINKYVDQVESLARRALEDEAMDVSTKKGRVAIKSVAGKVVTSRSYMENIGKELTAEQKKIPNKIDASRKYMRDTLDALRDEIRQPVVEWEDQETARVEAHKTAIQDISKSGITEGRDLTTLRSELTYVEAVKIGSQCEEFEDKYKEEKEQALQNLNRAIAARVKQEADDAELAQHRKEAAERAEREAAEEAERERVAAAERAVLAKAEADKRAAEEKQAQAEREKAAAEKAAEQAVIETESRLKREADERAAVIKAEADRVAAAEAARISDLEHRKMIDAEITEVILGETGMSKTSVSELLTLIADGKIPHITITY